MLEIIHRLRVLPIHVITPRESKETSIYVGEELESLIATLGGQVVDRVIQKMGNPDNATYIGRGKIEQVSSKIKELQIDVVVLNAMAKPRQIHALKRIFQKINPKIDVWDRVDLILQIFDKHATTTEAKLQIEMARMRYMGPRIYGMGFILSRQGGGIGSSGIGETNTELMRRHWRDQMKQITDQLGKINKTKELQLEKRKRAGFKTVSLVGYTNAGKSSLFQALTGKQTLVEDVLFATLDSTIGKMILPNSKEEILVTDTIGFIRNLPPNLIEAFKSTLMESIHADLLLHVIDMSDPEMYTKIKVVDDILRSLGRNMEDIIYIFNKVDRDPIYNNEEIIEKYSVFSPIFVSAKTKQGMEAVYTSLEKRLSNTSPLVF